MHLCITNTIDFQLNKNIYTLFDLLNKKLLCIGTFLLIVSNATFAQEFLKNVEDAFKKGNAKPLSQYFDKFVDITFSENVVTYGNKQAQQVVQKFFNKVEPKNITRIQKGYSHSNNTLYYMGELSTTQGTFQVYLFFVIKNATYYLKEIRFEKE